MDWIKQHRWLFFFEGLLLILFGILAIGVPQVFTVGVTLFIGWLLIFSGIFQAFRGWKTRETEGFWPTLFSSVLNIIVGILLLTYPIQGVLSLTLLLTIFFLLEGIYKIYLSLVIKPFPQWGWVFFSGIIALLLGIIILAGLPGTAAWSIGLLFGINMLFYGISLVALSLSVKSE